MQNKQHDLRMTSQRKLILEEVKKSKSHPTAYDVYEIVKKRLPSISLGTVYRNLEVLSENGYIDKIELSGAQRRFDGQLENHYHVRCQICGKLEDLEISPVSELEPRVGDISGYDVKGHRVEFVGICPQCRAKSADNTSPAN